MISARCYIFVSLLLSSCFGAKGPNKLTKELEPHFTNKLEDKSTGLATRIDLMGYYSYGFPNQYKAVNLPDTFFLDIIFYDDGTFASNFPILGFTNLDDYFNAVIADGKDNIFYTTAAVWGIYALSVDTIKAQFLGYPAKFTPTIAYERWYVITPERSIRPINTGDTVDPSFGEQLSKSQQLINNTGVARFVPMKNIPPPLTWMKTRKFFWRHEMDWIRYNKSNKK